MSKFITKLNAEVIDDIGPDGRALWRIMQPFIYQSDVAKQTFVAPIGTITDLDSAPRYPVIFWLFGAAGNEESAIHDYLYGAKLVSRAMADRVFLEAALLCGMPAWRAWGMYAGLRVCGASHW